MIWLVATPVMPACNQQMANQPKYKPLRESEFFESSQSERPLVDGTVARGYLKEDSEFYTGKTNTQPSAGPGARLFGAADKARAAAGASFEQGAEANPILGTPAAGAQAKQNQADVTTFPFTITAEVLERGRERFTIYCSVCHGRLGDGDGMIVRRGFRRPPSYHIDRLRNSPPGHFFDVITNGFGLMPDYAEQISPRDRWAIVAYIRALQFSRDARLSDVPRESRAELEKHE